MRKLKGFTLIELLVVIAIIALLLSVITPVLRKAKMAAWEVVCRNNLRHYGLAGQMYTEDNEMLYPNAWGSIFRNFTGEPHRTCQWHDQARNPVSNPRYAGSLWPYLGEQDKSHLCPVFDLFARQEGCRDASSDIPFEPIFGYSMNAFLGGFEFATGYIHALRVRVSDIKSPTSTFFFGEENPWVVGNRYGATLNDNGLCGGPQHPSTPGAWTHDASEMITRERNGDRYLDCLASFHKTTFEKKNDGFSNVVFVDGHVDMVDWDETYRFSRWTKAMPPTY